MVGVVELAGGMASPWMSLPMGCLLSSALFLRSRTVAILVGLLGCAMLGGWRLFLSLPIDDAGTSAQHPLGWVLNMFIYAGVAGAACGIAWIFRRVGEAVDVFDATLLIQAAAEREAATGEACAEARRELHASLQQYVRAALLRVDLLRRAAPTAEALISVERRLADLRDAVDRVVAELDLHAAASTV
jgi:hypothetical protein